MSLIKHSSGKLLLAAKVYLEVKLLDMNYHEGTYPKLSFRIPQRKGCLLLILFFRVPSHNNSKRVNLNDVFA